MEQQNNNLGLSTGLKIVCVLLPIVGLILYFVKGDEPAKKQDACKFALIGVGVGIALNVLMMLLTKSS